MKDNFFIIFAYVTIAFLFIAAMLAIWVESALASKFALTGLAIFGLGYALLLCRLK